MVYWRHNIKDTLIGQSFSILVMEGKMKNEELSGNKNYK